MHKITLDLKNPSNLKSFHSLAKRAARAKDVFVECNGTRIVFSVASDMNKLKELKSAAASVVNSCVKGKIRFDSIIEIEGQRPIVTYSRDNERLTEEA